MNRRSFGLAAFSIAALTAGAILGGATHLPRVHASAVKDASMAQEPAAKRLPPTPCKSSKDCPKDHHCAKVDDHKECVAPPSKGPVPPVVT